MKKAVLESNPEKKPDEYFRLQRTDRNLFIVDVIYVLDGKIVGKEEDEPSYLPIAFDKLRRRTANSYFSAVDENSK